MFSLFQGNAEEKLKALKIAKELADKSTLLILRKGLRCVSWYRQNFSFINKKIQVKIQFFLVLSIDLIL